ncbi:CCA tRNA nucleotidyltransferase [Candidatus Woesearchaeota archaeon]|nr:CCA tRNA nucleotidyltransferase [Candidatus Woesearchaeota archaeon]
MNTTERDILVISESEKKRLTPAHFTVADASALIKKISTLLKKAKLRASCVPGGSYAKGTMIKDNFDIDLFVRFDHFAYKEKDISAILGAALKPLKPELVHGSRDYFQLKRKNILFEIIPVLKIDDHRQAQNVTDMSPLHVDYVKKKMTAKMADEVRLAKQFCKGAGVYGAESYIRGFSGHVLDLLIIFYGSFEQLLKQASVWGERVVIDVEHHWKDPLRSLNAAKTISPLVVVDPIQPDRNAAAAVSEERFEEFKSQAIAFLKKPSHDFFKVKKLSVKDLRKKAGKDWLLIVKAKPLKGKDDIVGTKILKVHEHFGKLLKKHEFNVLDSGWEYGPTCMLFYIVRKERFSDKRIAIGPPISERVDASRFVAKHKNVFNRDGRLFAMEKRKYKSPDKLLKDLFKEDHIKEKVKAISLS